MNHIKIFVPKDTTACSLGADQIADRITSQAPRYNLSVELVRNGSRGALWLEPLLEIDINGRRTAFGSVTTDDIDSLLTSLASGDWEQHPLHLGATNDIPYLNQQQRVTFSRAGITDPLSLDDYRRHDGFKGLTKALSMTEQAIIEEVTTSGLRGRGGAAFPTGIKWQTVHDAPGAEKYIVCNADEGDSGTFADRLVMESDPYMLIEGIIIAGLAVGASQGYIYLRSEYPLAHQVLKEALSRAEQHGYLGDNILGSGRSFYLEVRLGAGAYICGEETSLLESLEGKRGLVRAKPPLPALEGLFGCPTVVNNVLSLSAVPFILAEGGLSYSEYGVGRSKGTLPFQLAGNISRGGLVELPFGSTLRQLVEGYGGGTASGRPVKAIQVGGPLGAYLPESLWDLPLDYEAFTQAGAVLGHGGIVVFDDTADMSEQARFSMAFCKAESCGKCTPCRIGSTRGVEIIDRIRQGEQSAFNLDLLEDLCNTMELGSLCAMGGMTPFPVRSAVNYFPEDFQRHG